MGTALSLINKSFQRFRVYLNPGVLILIALLVWQLNSKDILNPKRITVIVSADIEIYAQGLAGFQSVSSHQMEILYLDVIQGNLSDSVRIHNPDLIVAVGQKAAAAALETFDKIPIVVSMVHSPHTLGVGKTLCGIRMDVPIDPYFKTLREVQPSARYVYSFYSTRIGEYAAMEGVYRDFQNNLIYIPVKVDSATDIQAYLTNLKLPIDAIYIITDPVYNQEMFDYISNYAMKKSIILMSSFPGLIRRGAHFGFVPDYTDLGLQTGHMVNKILNKKAKCPDIGLSSPQPEKLLFCINNNYAIQSGIRFPENVAYRSEISRLAIAGIGLYQKERYKASKKVFQYIQKRDADNYIAQYYLDLMLNKNNGAQINRLLELARKSVISLDYNHAIQYYTQILNIKPDHPAASKGLAEAKLWKSEEFRKKAVFFQKAGKHFDAIRAYNQSLQIYSKNKQAIEELHSLKSRLLPGLEPLLNSGIDHYNNRNYTQSVLQFENVLLLRPGHALALEYLQLSKKKLEAFKKLNQQYPQRKTP